MDLMSPVLLRAATSVASGPAARLLHRKTVRFRVSRIVARQAAEDNITISARALRRWLKRPDVQGQLMVGTVEPVASAVSSLAWLLVSGETAQRARDAETVLFLVLAAFLRAQDPAAGSAAAHEWEVGHIQAQGDATRQEVRTTGQAILERFSASESFTDEVRGLHPWRRSEAVAIRGFWPAIETLVHELTTTAERGRLLRQWRDHPPAWYAEAPAELLCWLGELAVQHGEDATAARCFGVAVDRGAFPVGYWTARQAMSAFKYDPAEAKRLLEATREPHPLVTCLLAWEREAFTEGIDALLGWTPTSDGAQAIKLQVQARLTVGAGALSGGIASALKAAEDENATGAAVLAAELLLSRARYGQTVNRLADAEQAAALATRARNARRTWHGDSVAAALVAVKAAALGGDPVRAWTLLQRPPDGDATDAEVADPRLLREAARLAAINGRFEQARAAAEGIGSEFIDKEIAAHEFSAMGETDEAVAAWKAALSVATDEGDSLIAAMSLAELGATVPDLGDLHTADPETVREIRLVEQAMKASGETLDALRVGAADSLILTLKLAERHGDRGEARMAAEVLKAGAQRWTQPRMMLMAASRYREAGDLELARSGAESAMTMGGSSWAGEFEARVLLLKLHDATGDWEQATQQARALVSLDPHDPDARWALAHFLVRRGDHEDAWTALTPQGDSISPRDRHDAFTWISLAARYDTSSQFVRRALATMRRWPDDEQLMGVFIGQLYAGLRREDLTPTQEDLAALHAASADYAERFPTSSVMRTLRMPEDDPLAPLIDELKEQHKALEQVASQVRDGRLPLGLLAEAAGRSYAEACLKRAAGFIRCHDVAREAEGTVGVTMALDRPVVVDTTAAHTLALLDPATRARLLGVFGQVLATDAAYRDALHGHESLGLLSTMSVGWDPVAGRPSITTIDQSVAQQLADRAEQMIEIFRGAVRRPWPQLRVLKDMPGDSGWVSSLDMAATEGMPLWCDDAVLRGLAASFGVRSFDTLDLLRNLAAAGRLERDLVSVTEATLVVNYFADLGFDRSTFDFAATMDQWQPRGTAFAIARPAAWSDPAAVVDFAFAAADKCADAALDDLEGWITAAALGLVRIAPDGDAAGLNLRVLLAQALAQSWMRPDRLPVVLRAVRLARDESQHTSDPVEPVLADAYRELAGKHGHALAAPLLMSLVQFAPEADRLAGARVVLTYKD